MSNTLTDSPCKIVQNYLISQSLFTSPTLSMNWPLFMASFPDVEFEYDSACLFDEMPQKDGRSMIDGELYLHYSMTLRIRSSEYPTGWTKAMNVLQDISSIVRQTVTLGAVSYKIQSITTSGIHYTGIESGTKRRYLFEVPMIMAIRQV